MGALERRASPPATNRSAQRQIVSLRFGPIHGDTEQHKWNRSRFASVVSGIAHYGNCIGVPSIGGER